MSDVNEPNELYVHETTDGWTEIEKRRLTPAEMRLLKELEANASEQPFGWGRRVYLSVTGPRFACCYQSWDEGHAYWCRVPDDQVPGDAGDWLANQ